MKHWKKWKFKIFWEIGKKSKISKFRNLNFFKFLEKISKFQNLKFFEFFWKSQFFLQNLKISKSQKVWNFLKNSQNRNPNFFFFFLAIFFKFRKYFWARFRGKFILSIPQHRKYRFLGFGTVEMTVFLALHLKYISKQIEIMCKMTGKVFPFEL